MKRLLIAICAFTMGACSSTTGSTDGFLFDVETVHDSGTFSWGVTAEGVIKVTLRDGVACPDTDAAGTLASAEGYDFHDYFSESSGASGFAVACSG